jgi:molybdenum ABC transporter molybdate-binding protein
MWYRYAPWLAFALSVTALAGVLLFWTLASPDDAVVDAPGVRQRVVVVHAAAAVRPPLEKAAKQFEAEYGVPVELRFDASETLLAKLRVSRQGDLFLPADESYVQQARHAGLVEQDYTIARLTGVAIFRSDFPKPAAAITWDDVFQDGFRLAQPNPATAVGKLTREGLEPVGLWERIDRHKAVSVGTVTEAANAVKLGSADGAIVWDAVAKAYPTLKVVRLPHLNRVAANVVAAVCKDAQARTEARWFAEYLAGPGKEYFRQAGYTPPAPVAKPKARGARPGEDAEIVLYAGAMLRPAVEETIKEFEAREKVRVTRVYNGCGILVAQMRSGPHPDLYIACDPRFMGDVADLFAQPEVISNNQLVIAVPKGNPNQLHKLTDLSKDGLRVGVGHEQQCALGSITKETFIQSGVYAAVRKNVKVESPTGDLLVNQLLTGSLDAVVCYVSNVTPNADRLDAIPVTGIPCAAPEQPVAIALGSAKADLAARLVEYLQTAESRRRFESLGFGWGKADRRPKK